MVPVARLCFALLVAATMASAEVQPQPRLPLLAQKRASSSTPAPDYTQYGPEPPRDEPDYSQGFGDFGPNNCPGACIGSEECKWYRMQDQCHDRVSLDCTWRCYWF
mmetsp:Transcript_87153/g.259996  ORF Transcript_87153/g.259996 Transcript_87153/m.259996 type:complete len:106 (+) Transcript_87153:33-350(+)